MNKYFTFFCSVESKYDSKKIFYDASTELLRDMIDNTSQLLDTVKMSPPKEVINKILEHAVN